MKITHRLSRFATFFKESSLVVRLVIIAFGIGIIAGTATVVAMVAMPNDSETSTNRTTTESSGVTGDTDNQLSTEKENEQTTDADATTATPQASQTTPQDNTRNTSQGSTGNSQQEAQPQTPARPTYADSYLFKSNCASNPQQTSTQIDPYGYNKCYSSSYTAWKVQERYGSAPLNWGDPKKWPAAANSSSIPVGTTPKLHSVGIQTTSAAGWSVWVEAVHDDDTMDISFYNWNNGLVHGTQYNVSPSVFSNYIYFGE
jgi:surface antigen